ncbi:uncharacterized protein HD556DRAFT_657560 [Suillus plorans]|uniref:Uncharacterized protein n=1 Tax=Suillus plorans TaxID=116603 RepID=A0A9P7AKL2_9AGAM|nr:uncharacterized protein HD556DRAFT_657560 [Suillus plorans]KAG1791462.1 hypothetical protein HD556DRAFT_657560 [Suillus plorans]
MLRNPGVDVERVAKFSQVPALSLGVRPTVDKGVCPFLACVVVSLFHIRCLCFFCCGLVLCDVLCFHHALLLWFCFLCSLLSSHTHALLFWFCFSNVDVHCFVYLIIPFALFKLL